MRPRLSAILSIGSCLLVIAVLSATTPDPATRLRTYADASVGEWASTREFDLRVTEVAHGRVVQPADDYRDPLHSQAGYLVVSVDARSRSQQNLILTTIELSTRDGRTIHPREEFVGQALPTVAPGFTGIGQYVFEIPDERLADARLIVGPPANAFAWYDVAARVDLGIDEPLSITATPIVITESRSVVTR